MLHCNRNKYSIALYILQPQLLLGLFGTELRGSAFYMSASRRAASHVYRLELTS
jgi:hypothetical protein